MKLFPADDGGDRPASGGIGWIALAVIAGRVIIAAAVLLAVPRTRQAILRLFSAKGRGQTP